MSAITRTALLFFVLLFEGLNWAGHAHFPNTQSLFLCFWVWLAVAISYLQELHVADRPEKKPPKRWLLRRIVRAKRKARHRPPFSNRRLYRRLSFRLRCTQQLVHGRPPKLSPTNDPISTVQRQAKTADLLDVLSLFSEQTRILNPGLFHTEVERINFKKVVVDNPSAFAAGLDAGEAFPVIWDTGASYTVSPCTADFIDGIQPLATPIVLDGLATGLAVQGHGTVRWVVRAVDGTFKTVEMGAFYTPRGRSRLLSPQSYCQQLKAAGLEEPNGAWHPKFTVTWQDGSQIAVAYAKANNLPMSMMYNEATVARRTQELHLCVTDASNQNLTEAQKELLRWHFRLGHLNFEAIQLVLRSGALATSEGAKILHRAASKCAHPRCASCQFGKQKRRPTPSKVARPVASNEGAIKQEDLLPGQRVSVDHFICHTKGRLYTSKGKTQPESMFSGGCMFVDHASGAVHVEHQVSLTTHETLQSKHRYEEKARDCGVIVQNYLSDNGTAFSSADFAKDLARFRQTTNFAGVGAHHHNGVAERAIQTIMSMARTMMLHAAIHWPDAADTALWPMAVDYAVYIHNHLPNRKTGLAPIDIYTKTKWPTHKCNDLQVWGCPVFVLDSKMQDGKKLPRWETRSRRAVFIGLSAKHASTAPLVLNLASLFISPQFHCVFDCWFSTVIADPEKLPDLNDPVWDRLFGESHFQYFFDDYLPPDLGDDWGTVEAADARASEVRRAQDAVNPILPLGPAAPLGSAPRRSEENPPAPIAPFSPVQIPGTTSPVPLPAPAPNHSGELSSPQLPPVVPVEPPPREPPPRVPSPRRESRGAATPAPPRIRAPSPAPLRRSTRSNFGQPAADFRNEFMLLEGLMEESDGPSSATALASFAAYVASASDPDTLTYDQAIRDVDAEEWKAQMNKEITSLIAQGTWEVVRRSDARTQILPGTWTLRRKRNPDGTLKGLKARWCVRGDLQPPVADTYAPVVQWSTIRLVLYFTLFFNLSTRCIDFSNAFVQAPLTDPIYVHLPRGFHSTDDRDVCLKLKKSLYGITQAPRLWYEHLKAKLEKRGFKQSRLDPCLFYSKSVMLVIWVDDVVMASRDPASLDRLIADLKTDSDLTDEGELTAFLGIQVQRDIAGKQFTLTQPGLTERVLDTLGLQSGNTRWTPADAAALGSDVAGDPLIADWNYRSVVGMLLYLSNNTRPDIAFAVHQCARFSHNPKHSHGLAVKAIGRYLLCTRDKGLILEPTGDIAIDCYVDADFAGLWRQESDQDPLCVKSRTGYLITIGGCPLTWTSKLQTEIALSTMEAEYIALSQSMRELLPLRSLVKKMATAMAFNQTFAIRTHSTVFEDNNGALILASSPRMTPRSKHIAVKYHFFRSHVASGDIRICKINSEDQKADIFTKGLVRTTFETVRLLLMGW